MIFRRLGIALCLGTIVLPVFGLDVELPGLLTQARAARDKQNYQTSVEAYKTARKLFPNAVDPARELGTLYEGQKLYSLALDQFADAVRLAPGDRQLRLSYAETFSYLDRNQDAVRTLETAFRDFPYDRDIAQALGWLYFKTQQNAKGVALIQEILKNSGPDRDLEMTLGTLYSGLYDYELSRGHYLKAIALSPSGSATDKHFRSICWYNLSLLEKAFLRTDRAFQAIQRSLDDEDRSAGWLALGELHQTRLDVPKAMDAFQKAAKTDDTPLSLYDIALLENLEGHYDESLAATHQIEDFRDDSWIYDFGVTKSQFLRDMAQLYRDIWTAKARSLDVEPRLNWWSWFSWIDRKIAWSFTAWYWDQRYKVLQVKLAQEAETAGNQPEAWSDLVLANRDHPEVSLKYLHNLRAFEVPRNPSALASYLAEEGRIRHDPNLLTRAVSAFQTPDQEADKIEAEENLVDALREKGAPTKTWYLWVNRIYERQPGALPSHGLALPVVDVIYGGDAPSQTAWRHAVSDFADSSGWDARPFDRPGVEYTLSLDIGGPEGSWYLNDAHGTIVLQGDFSTKGDKKEVLKEIFSHLHDRS